MPAIVNKILPDSIAQELEIKQFDEIISINSLKPSDLMDYKYLISSEDITLHIKHSDGEEEIIDIEKDADEDLGIIFESAVFDRIIPCNNKCVFCFVDQQPEGLSESLYIKDDDYRLSYLQGTYITLTNLSSSHRKRIEDLRPGPLYISVHTTNPDLRIRMLKNKRAGNILNELKWLDSLEIPVHTQIVLCPGLNDGAELDKTLNDLASFRNIMLSIAVVPVGITRFRTDSELKTIDNQLAERVIEQIYRFNRKIGHDLAYPADEIYIKAGQSIPEFNFYRDFGQLDDGIGSVRLLIEDFNKRKNLLPSALNKPRKLTIATGKLACKALNPIVDELNKINNLEITLCAVQSRFWGEDVTVSGLITGKDILDNLMPVRSNLNELIIPSVMLRKYTESFLDDIGLSEVQDKLGAKIHTINDYYSTKELIEIIKQ